jgi:heptosyltransferase III
MSLPSLRWRLMPRLLKLFFPVPAEAPVLQRPVRSVVCLRPGKLGDMIVATPLFSALKMQGGVTRLAVVCSAANEVVIKHNPHIDNIRPLNFHRVSDVLGATGWLRRQRFDAIIDLTPGFSRTNFLMSCYAGPATLRVGIEKELVADRYHLHIGGRETPLADRMLEAGEALTGNRFERPARFEIYTAAGDREAASEFVNPIKTRGTLIGINLSAGSPQRQWAYGRFAALVSLLSSRAAPVTMALIAVGQQREWALRLAAAHSSCVAVPQFPFLTITELIGACSLLISPDTALIHAAGARGVPVVGLYTVHAENFARWAPSRERGEVIQSSSAESINGIEPVVVCEKTLNLIKKIRL